MTGEAHPMREPVLWHPPELLLKAQGIRWAIFDVDGVLTDGRLWYGTDGNAFKVFHVLDGHGIKMLVACGIPAAILIARS